jgi:hypothetical protein
MEDIGTDSQSVGEWGTAAIMTTQRSGGGLS